MRPSILITGGAGFIGSNFALDWVRAESDRVINLDALTYAGNPNNLSEISDSSQHELVVGSINDDALVSSLLRQHQPRTIIHFAAESHVDRSIHGPEAFI